MCFLLVFLTYLRGIVVVSLWSPAVGFCEHGAVQQVRVLAWPAEEVYNFDKGREMLY